MKALLKTREKMKWRDDIRVLPAMPLHIWLQHRPPIVTLEKDSREYTFKFEPGTEPSLAISDFALGVNVWNVRDEFFRVASPSGALDFLTSYADLLRSTDELVIPALTWTEFRGWQRLLGTIATHGFPQTFTNDESSSLPFFWPQDTMLPAELRSLYFSKNLSESTREWLKGTAQYVTIAAKSRLHMARYPEDAATECSVTTTTIVESILATIYFAKVLGVAASRCDCEGCDNIFEQTTQHQRRFCSSKCAHTQGTRERRKIARDQALLPAPKTKTRKANG